MNANNDRVLDGFQKKNSAILCLLMKVASALKGLNDLHPIVFLFVSKAKKKYSLFPVAV